jgi:hypothetical protein
MKPRVQHPRRATTVIDTQQLRTMTIIDQLLTYLTWRQTWVPGRTLRALVGRTSIGTWIMHGKQAGYIEAKGTVGKDSFYRIKAVEAQRAHRLLRAIKTITQETPWTP